MRAADYLDFLKTVGKSKRLLRSGFVREQVVNPESVAEHSFRTGVIAMVFSDKVGNNLNKDKLIKMALIHDIGEIITGDVVVQRGEIIDLALRDSKEEQERIGIKEIFDQIQEGEIYAEIFEEMIARKSPEAKIFWQFDKLELALTALEYEEEQNKQLDEFFLDANTHMKEPLLKVILSQIIKSRKKEYRASLAKKLGEKV
ncbi:MAG: hypothetical protein A3C22_01035 [Candidatus Levybacteria bacterium RIFCSPHIGHO2_02_FULL_37_10]|nr:MAG: hypothetical protein A3C22_01035 [Candidatus Levybacteria bacterium RIFCSPHIGHO2_02_FULL_37_10]OGH41688.1 MAG: hypothetical protein A3H79_00815 [Candidatus Levybacteria bacterium RIFCSPLOWO2_02_FULL_36_8b]